MTNKKGQAAMEFLMTYGWAILAAVIAIGVLAYFGVFSPQQQWKIYLNECHNETAEYSGYLCNDGTAILDYTYYDEIKIENKTCKSHYGNYTEEVCNKTEVDNIQFDSSCKYCAYMILPSGEKYYGYLPKENLTLDWLNSNCNCTNRKYNEYYSWQKDGCDRYGFKSACDYLNASYNKCLNFKCGDYEVDKQ